MVQHQLQKELLEGSSDQASSASLISQSVAVTWTHQRMEAPPSDKVIYEFIWISVKSLHKSTSVSDLVCVLERVKWKSGPIVT